MNYAEFASICQEVNREQSEREHLLTWRYPWFNMAYNYFWLFIAVLLAATIRLADFTPIPGTRNSIA